MSKQPVASQKTVDIVGPLITWGAILMVSIAAYSNTLRVPFVLDDRPNIQDNTYLHVTQLEWPALRDAMFAGPSARRPLPKLTLALNYYAEGLHVWGYHAVNLAIHIACGALVYLLAWDVFQRVGFAAGVTRWAALIAALLFLSHPIQIQAVTYIVQRMASMAAMFYLAGLLFYVLGRAAPTVGNRWLCWCPAVLCWLLSLASKENAVTLPMAVLLYEFFFIQNLHVDWLKRTLKIAVPAGAIVLLVLVLTPGVRDEIVGGYNDRDFTMGERLLTQFRVVVMYLSLVAWPLPSRFCLTHEILVSRGLFDPATTALSVLCLGGLIGFAVATARRWPVVSFGILWVFLHLAVESSVLPLELAYEHRMYLPMAGIAWMAAWTLFTMVRDVRLATCVAAAVVMLLGSATFTRNEVWRSNEALWRDVLAKYPNSARANNNLGYSLVAQGNLTEGTRHFQLAIQHDPEYADPHFNLGTVLDAQGKTAEATALYHRAVELDPELFQAHNNLGNKLAQQGKLDEAIEHFRTALKLHDRFALAHNNLGNALTLQANYDEAADEYREAIALDPEYAQARFSLAKLLAAQGERAAALEEYRHALELASAQGNRSLAAAIRAQLEAYE